MVLQNWDQETPPMPIEAELLVRGAREVLAGVVAALDKAQLACSQNRAFQAQQDLEEIRERLSDASMDLSAIVADQGTLLEEPDASNSG